MPSEPVLSAITTSLPFALHHATALVDRAADRYLRDAHGISYSLFVVLMAIGVLGRPSMREVADGLDVSRASVTQRVSELRERALVRVDADDADARVLRVSLTAAGSALLDASWRGLEQHDDGIGEGVDEVALATALGLVITNARRALGLPTGGATSRGPGPRAATDGTAP